MKTWVQRLGKLDAHHRLGVAVLLATILGVVVFRNQYWPTRLVLIWMGYSGTMLILSWCTMLGTTPKYLSTHAGLNDSSRSFIFLLVVLAAMVSLLAIVSLLATTKGQSPWKAEQHILLSLVAVLSSWLLIHTMFALHYAHLYYRTSVSPTHAAHLNLKGLQFPDDQEPDYLDFAYFSFVIGMASQVSDVQVQSKQMRRQVLLHSVLSFFFNALIIALTINALSGVL